MKIRLICFGAMLVVFVAREFEILAQGNNAPNQRARFESLDTNQDGAISKEEAGPELWNRLKNRDVNGDSKVTPEEYRASEGGPSKSGDQAEPDHAEVSYGPEARQWLNIYLADSTEPAPVFFFAHANGGTAHSIERHVVQNLTREGFTIISWESIATAQSGADLKTIWEDSFLAFEWIKDNADRYHFDPDNIIIGGRSRGTGASWKLAHSLDPSIKGLYMIQALGDRHWLDLSLFDPRKNVTAKSPPLFLPYFLEPGTTDSHDPEHGFKIVKRYEELEIGDKITLEHSLKSRANKDPYQFFSEFAASLVD